MRIGTKRDGIVSDLINIRITEYVDLVFCTVYENTIVICAAEKDRCCKMCHVGCHAVG